MARKCFGLCDRRVIKFDRIFKRFTDCYSSKDIVKIIEQKFFPRACQSFSLTPNPRPLIPNHRQKFFRAHKLMFSATIQALDFGMCAITADGVWLHGAGIRSYVRQLFCFMEEL